MKEIKIYSSKSDALKLLIIALIFVVIGYILLQDAEINSTKYYLSIFVMIFFGLGLVVGLYKIFKTNLILKISARGIYHRKKDIKWEEILETQSTNASYQNYFNLYLESYDNPNNSLITDFQNLRKGNKVSMIIDNENVDMAELEKLTNLLVYSEPQNRELLIRKSKIFKRKRNYFIYLLLLMLYLISSIRSIELFLVSAVITFIAVLIQRWYRGEVANSKIKEYSEIFALVGFVNMGLLGIGIFSFKNITDSIGYKLTNQIENYRVSHNSYPQNINEIQEYTDLNFFENILIDRVSYRKVNDNYLLQLRKINSKVAVYDKEAKEWH